MLKRLLALAGIRATATCQCNRRAAEMDLQGPAWCMANLDLITTWLAEEAARRNIRCWRPAARALVWTAILLSRVTSSFFH